MADHEPLPELDPRFSSDGAVPTAWTQTREQLKQAEVYWLTTVRSDGRPHVTPLVGAWLEGALYFSTGADEQKARNLAGRQQCAITTGNNSLQGLDIVVEGEATIIRDEAMLRRVAAAYSEKYAPPFRYTVKDGAFAGDAGNISQVYQLTPARAFAFGKGTTFSQTRYRF